MKNNNFTAKRLVTAEKSTNTTNVELTHNQLVEITTSSLYTIIKTDDLLNDLPADITLEEVISKIAVEHGRSITVTLIRDRENPLEIIVPQGNTTVRDLKKAIKRHFEIFQKRKKYSDQVKISWKYIWHTYSLESSGTVLENDDEFISTYGIFNKSKIKFVKKYRTRKRTI